MRRILIIALYVFLVPDAGANITLPAIFSDHMVLQQNETVTIWGWAKPGEMVRISTSWDPEKNYSVRVNSLSAWNLEIETPGAGGPYQLLIEGYNTIEIKDVLIGEVWLGSGQSNMEWTPSSGIDRAEEEIAGADYPEIRFFTLNTITAGEPQQLMQGSWVKCTPETMRSFSALLYFFGRELHREMKVPVGLINSSWGGTPIEIWMPATRVREDRMLDAYAKLLKPVPWGPTIPGTAYNAMIHPLIPYRIKGALWYQGEGNVEFPEHYARALQTLIGSWRAAWGYQFPLYYVQIAPYDGYGTDNVRGAIIRDQQRKVLQLTEGTGMVVISDIGDLKDIHPKNKQDVGKRLAAWALHHNYGFADMHYSGPLFRSCEIAGDRIIVHFDYSEGLFAMDGEPAEFQVLGEDGAWQDANALIKGDVIEVVLSGGPVQGIRYAYRNNSDPNLFNNALLPASCFEVLFSAKTKEP